MPSRSLESEAAVALEVVDLVGSSDPWRLLQSPILLEDLEARGIN